jgi:hypothetical protein
MDGKRHFLFGAELKDRFVFHRETYWKHIKATKRFVFSALRGIQAKNSVVQS